MQSSIALQIKTHYKTNNIYCTINMEPQKINQLINILQKINSWKDKYIHTNTICYILLVTWYWRSQQVVMWSFSFFCLFLKMRSQVCAFFLGCYDFSPTIQTELIRKTSCLVWRMNLKPRFWLQHKATWKVATERSLKGNVRIRYWTDTQVLYAWSYLYLIYISGDSTQQSCRGVIALLSQCLFMRIINKLQYCW